MKRTLACILLLLSLTACASAVSDKGDCSGNGEVCIKVRAEEPIRFGEPVIVTITVTSGKDITDLGVSLYHDVDVVVEGPQSWEKDLQDAAIFKGGASCGVAIKANHPLTFTRKLYLPPREGEVWIKAEASTQSLRTADTISIYVTRQGGTVYLSGTSIPITPGPLPTVDPVLLATLRAMPTETSWPTLTPIPPVPLLVTPTSPPYPPPGSPPPGTPYP